MNINNKQNTRNFRFFLKNNKDALYENTLSIKEYYILKSIYGGEQNNK